MKQQLYGDRRMAAMLSDGSPWLVVICCLVLWVVMMVLWTMAARDTPKPLTSPHKNTASYLP